MLCTSSTAKCKESVSTSRDILNANSFVLHHVDTKILVVWIADACDNLQKQYLCTYAYAPHAGYHM